MTGVLIYSDLFSASQSVLGYVHLGVFFGLWLIGEIIYQCVRCRRSSSKGYNTSINGEGGETELLIKRKIIRLEMFKEMMQQGKLLVILDDLVVDVKGYMTNHPGGKKVLQTNIGRDVSKFFYGGYQMGNN